jgi:hypothetical protein
MKTKWKLGRQAKIDVSGLTNNYTTPYMATTNNYLSSSPSTNKNTYHTCHNEQLPLLVANH